MDSGKVRDSGERGEQTHTHVLYFATTSDIKFKQYCAIFADFGVELRRATVISSALVEPQVDSMLESDQTLLVSHPLRQISRFVSRMGNVPYMVEDTMLFVEGFSRDYKARLGLPGPDTKNWWINLGCEGLLALLRGSPRRGAVFVCQIGIYFGGSSYMFVDADVEGTIAEAARESQSAIRDIPASNPHYFHKVFVPAGTAKTIAELDGSEFRQYDYRRRCVEKLMSTNPFTSHDPNTQLQLRLG